MSEYDVLDIHGIMESLAANRPVFHSEADFQFALAWEIQTSVADCDVRLEYKPFTDERMYLDVWLPKDGLAIELKYATQQLNHRVEDEEFVLKNQSALDIGRHDYVKDVGRLERIIGGRDDAHKGLAILLTNDPQYWTPPSARWTTTADSAFRVHHGARLSGILQWSERAGAGTIQGRQQPIRLEYSYEISWRDFSYVGDERFSNFRYVAVEVGN